MVRRGQSAMEYLMTYGWALLVIVVVLAALVLLGIFNPPTPETCSFPPGVFCTGLRMDTASQYSFNLRNAMGKTMYVCGVVCTTDLSTAHVWGTMANCLTTSTYVAGVGADLKFGPEVAATTSVTEDYPCLPAGASTLGTKVKGQMALYYVLAGDLVASVPNARMTVADVGSVVQAA